jgi:hypothetical protein
MRDCPGTKTCHAYPPAERKITKIVPLAPTTVILKLKKKKKIIPSISIYMEQITIYKYELDLNICPRKKELKLDKSTQGSHCSSRIIK